MKKRFKSRKKRRYIKKIIYFFIAILFIYISKYINVSRQYNKAMMNAILENMTESYNINNNYIYKVFKTNYKAAVTSPKFILNLELNYKPKSLSNSEEEVIFLSESNSPIVYIYNSHQGEKYSNKYLEDYNIVPSVVTASYMLKEKLENIGIETIVEDNDILLYMKQNNYDHSKSYIASRYFLNKVIDKYNSIKLYIDLHRDSVNGDVTTVRINDKEYAKVMFVIGLKYNTYEYNLAVVQNINEKLNEQYNGISRGILKKDNIGANGIYNQDLSPNIILIELGGVDNNIDQINNTLDVLSIVIGEYINEKEEEQ